MSFVDSPKLLQTMRFKVVVLLTITVSVFGCNNAEKGETRKVENDSMARASALKAEDSTIITSKKLDKWIAAALQKPGIEWSSLHLEEYAHEDKHVQEPFTPPANFFTDYAEVLRWSPDSSYVLDIGSYGSVLVKD